MNNDDKSSNQEIGIIFLVQPGGFRHEAEVSISSSIGEIKNSLSIDLNIPIGKIYVYTYEYC